jgi:hypothetical protein
MKPRGSTEPAECHREWRMGTERAWNPPSATESGVWARNGRVTRRVPPVVAYEAWAGWHSLDLASGDVILTV